MLNVKDKESKAADEGVRPSTGNGNFKSKVNGGAQECPSHTGLPQGLKPASWLSVSGTTEVTPFPVRWCSFRLLPTSEAKSKTADRSVRPRLARASGPMTLGRWTAEGGCPHMSGDVPT